MFETLLRGGRNGERTVVAAGDADAEAAPKLSIGLALGGGAARGWAHIGVIRTLIAQGIVPDVIVGTSIGAVVGGCYAAGQLDVVEEWARKLTRRGILGYLDFSFTGSGLIGGGRLAERLDETLQNARIEELPIRFAAIGTEIGTGHEIWLTRGRLVDALRASYALPGLFSPVQVGKRWLMDGALVNPIPVSAARALGARLVIAVNVNVDLFGRGTIIYDQGADADRSAAEGEDKHPRRGLFGADQLMRRLAFGAPGRPGLTAVMAEAFNIVQDRITRARLAGDPPDVLVSPRLNRLSLFDFHRAEEAIALGADATEKAMESINEAMTALA